MSLTFKNISYEEGNVDIVEKLIQSSFPPDEQESMEDLLKMAAKPMVNFMACYNDEEFCGMIYVVESSGTLFVLYLAVPDELRSKGYGAAIITAVRERFDNKDVVLHVEQPDKTKDNYEQRIRRIRFYEKLGFKDTGYRIDSEETVFYLMSTAKEYNVDTYMELMREYSGGTYVPKVYTVKE